MVSTKTKKTTAKKSVAKKKATKKAVAKKNDIKTIVDPSVMPSDATLDEKGVDQNAMSSDMNSDKKDDQNSMPLDKKVEKKNSGNIILIIIAIALVAIFFIIK
ncbi:MAG: hypothetical protein P8N25_01925 [Alphaproteobacteria bacterium]|nr:hypothetical protein [Alphaproteobacteria bacterium]